MAQTLGIANALWMAGWLIAKLNGQIAMGWWPVLAITCAPFIAIALLCWWAMMYDAIL